MIRFLCMAAIAVLVGADQLDNTVDIGATVKEVENMLAKDPRLPRLTRGEILKLIDEVRTGKDVVVVLPDNQSAFNDSAQTTTSKPKRPIKRRRKKPTVRPVYVHSTTTDLVSGGNAESNSPSTIIVTPSTAPETSQSPWIPSTTTRPKVKTTAKPEYSGGLPPVPGLSVVEDINSWDSSTRKPSPNIFITPTPTTSTPPSPSGGLESPPNMKVAAESLGPEMKDLLTRFGLLGSESTTEKVIYQGDLPVPTIDPEVYSRFKPLPVKSSADFVSPDMKSFLASYGLLDTRQGKDMKAAASQDNKTPLDYIPASQKDVLSQLGLWRDGKAIDLSPTKNVPKHVFKPNKVEETSSKEELAKVSKILTKLKEIGEGNDSQMTELSPSDVEELLFLENNTRLAAQGDLELPDDSAEKNEVKRNPQVLASASASASASSSDTADSETSTETSASTTEATTIADSSISDSGDTTERGASAVDLEDSFGGGLSTTTKRPNGFYFLLDWNSFLDVGLDDRAIHLNFSPKVGNPANFLPVTIGNSQSRK